jgi:outer membrane immunogenic protein
MNISLSTRAALLSSTAMVLLAGSAMAADLTHVAPPPPPPLTPTPAISWTGFYVGVNAGWVGLDSKAIDENGFYGTCCGAGSSETATLDPSGGLIGGQAGYNWQSGTMVVGVEGDFDAADARGSKTVWPDHATFATGLDSLATARLRLGFLPTQQQNLLLFATGGYAGGYIKDTLDPVALVIGNSSWSNGWTIGGGAEWALNNQWSVKAEALYVSFGDRTTSISDEGTYRFKFENSAVVARAGLNFHF